MECNITAAAQHVLSIPELLSTIILFSDRKSNASNLVVCKRWAEEVIKVEWEVLDGDDPLTQFRLFRLLAPIVEVARAYKFTRELTHDDWVAFNRYALRIKSFTLYSDEWRMYGDILNSIGSRERLLPNLKYLEAPCDTQIYRLFVHPHLISLTIRPSPEGLGNDEDPHKISSTLTRLSEDGLRPLHLRHLAFDGLYFEGNDFSIVEPALINLLRPLEHHLMSLALHPTWLSINVTHAVARFPRLVKLVATDYDDDISVNPLTFSDALDPKSFSTLQNLAVMIRFDRAVSCLSSGIERLSSLTTLALISDRVEQPAIFTRLLSLIAQVSPLLTDLEVESSQRLGSQPHDHKHMLSFKELRPLLQLENLERLVIVHPSPLQLDYQDLKTVAQKFKHLSTLVLNPEPSERTHTTLHMSAVSALSFSANPHGLEDISLYVDTSPERFPKTDELVVLKGLKRLSFGYSMMTKDAVIPSSVYLSRVVPQSFLVPWNLSTTSSFPFYSDNFDRWQEVISLLPAFMEILRTGQERAFLSQKGSFSIV
ncbi:hypothetical protein ONZ45_g16624 [Pleurotus djamor]|nr:hypothetical protein ONZ45_g16624 [Pleurotus djamor]